jgi:ankyrin repeat protein
MQASNYINLFQYFCKNGHLENAQELFQAKPDLEISEHKHYAFRMACQNGHLDVVQYLLDIMQYKEEMPKEIICDCIAIACCDGNLNVVKLLFNWIPNLNSKFHDNACRLACEYGHLEVVKYIFQINPTLNISTMTLMRTCQMGQLEVLKYLLQINPDIISSRDYEAAFVNSCQYGHLEVAKYLFQVKPSLNISIDNNIAFRIVCENGKIQIANWFASINPKKYVVVVENGRIVSWNVIKELPKHEEIMYVDEIEVCPICSDQLCTIQTSCNHTFCEPCMLKWLKNKNNCPCCRSSLNREFHVIQLKK